MNPFLMPEDNKAAPQTPSNPFLMPEGQQVDNKPAQEQNIVNANTGQTEPSFDQAQQTFADKLDIFNRGFERYAIGGLQLINAATRSTVGKLPIIGEGVTNATQAYDTKLNAQNQASEAQYQSAYARTPSPITDALGRIGGATIASAPALFATPTSLPGAIAQGAAASGMAGTVEYAEDAKQRAAHAIGAAALGGGATVAFSGAASILNALGGQLGASSFVKKMFSPKAAAKEDVANAVKLDYVSEDDALNALSNVTDNSLSLGDQLGKGQSKLGKVRELQSSIKLGEAEKDVVSQNILGATQKAKQDVLNTVGNMSSPEKQILETQAFDSMKKQFIGIDGKLSKEIPESNYLLKTIKDNKILSKKYKEIVNTNTPEFGQLPKNSIAQLHKMEQLIKEDIYNSTPNSLGQVIKPLSGTKLSELKQAQNEIRPILEQSNAYKEAMELSANRKTQEYYLNKLGIKKSLMGSKGDLSVEQIYDSIIPQKFLQKKFIKDVIKTGGDPEQATQIVKTIESLRGSPMWTVLKGDSESKIHLASGPIGAVQNFLSNLTLGRYHKALLDVMLNGVKYSPEISKIIKAKGVNKQAELLNLLGNVMKTTATTEVGTNVGENYVQ